MPTPKKVPKHRLPIYQGSNAEIAAEQQQRQARAEARKNATLARYLPNYANSVAETATKRNRRVPSYNTAANDSDTGKPLQLLTINSYECETFYMPDGETSAPDTNRSSDLSSTDPNAFFDSVSKIALTSDTSTSIASSTPAISPRDHPVAISDDQGRMNPIEQNRPLTESQLGQVKTLQN